MDAHELRDWLDGVDDGDLRGTCHLCGDYGYTEERRVRDLFGHVVLADLCETCCEGQPAVEGSPQLTLFSRQPPQ